LTVNTAEVPLNFTAVAPVRFAPLMATLVPGAPLAGVKLVIRGATVKLVALVAVPPGVVTLIGPVVAFAGTAAVICVLLLTMNVAASPLNLDRGGAGEGGAGDRDARARRTAGGGERGHRGRDRESRRAGGAAGGRRHADLAGRGARRAPWP
jgi:hypothetical protein